MATAALLALIVVSPCLLAKNITFHSKSRLSGEGWNTSVMAKPNFGSFWAVSASPCEPIDAGLSWLRLLSGTTSSWSPPGYLADWSLSKPSVLVIVGLSGSSTTGGSYSILFEFDIAAKKIIFSIL